MEPSVLRAMEQWPHVKAVSGWIQLDRRGRWLLCGRPIDMPQSIDFINANYSSDEQGRWFFQNGPQRVFVTLACTPMVYRLLGRQLLAHTNQRAMQLKKVMVDESGALILDTELGPGIMIDRDLAAVLPFFRNQEGGPASEQHIEDFLENPRSEMLYFALLGKMVPVLPVQSNQLPELLGFQPDPGEITQAGP